MREELEAPLSLRKTLIGEQRKGTLEKGVLEKGRSKRRPYGDTPLSLRRHLPGKPGRLGFVPVRQHRIV